jgi:hypothetical protein
MNKDRCSHAERLNMAGSVFTLRGALPYGWNMDDEGK